MKTEGNFLRRYLPLAPAALAFERVQECELHVRYEFERPVLDVGCGDGIFAKILFSERIDTGIDPDSAEIARAEQLNVYDELIVCPGNAIPKPDGTYRTILSNSVLEHIPDLDPVLVELHRLLQPGGRFHLTIPTDRLEHNSAPARILSSLGLHDMRRRYSSFHNRFWNHYNAHSLEDWRERFRKAGFDVVEERPFASPNFSSFYDFLILLALPSAVARKLFRRWFFLPRWRGLYAPVLHPPLRAIYDRLKGEPGESLVYYVLTRN